MYRLALLLALLIALAAVGCGGSDDDSDPAPSAVAQAPESKPSGDDRKGSASSESKKEKDDSEEKSSEDDEDEADDEHKTEDEVRKEQEEAYLKLPLERQSQIVETVIRSALLRFKLELVDVEVRRRGRAATAIVARRGACGFVASQEANLEVTIQQGLPGLKAVRFEVAGTRQLLGYYVLGCDKPELPSGAGRVVFEHTGVGGPYMSKRFEIKSDRWALEWVNQGASLAVILEPMDKAAESHYAKPVGSQEPESGRYEYRGGGTYRIRAHGAGRWELRIKEIG